MGQKIVCKKCRLIVRLKEECGCIDYCDIVCCGEPMKPKK
jgi:hypothetical protein